MVKPKVSRTIIIKFRKMELKQVNLLQNCFSDKKMPSIAESFKIWSDDLTKIGDSVNDWITSSPSLLKILADPKITMGRVFTSISIKDINKMIKDVSDESGQDLLHYFRLVLPPNVNPISILKKLKKIPVIEDAYLEGVSVPAAYVAPNDPKYPCQGYLRASPDGIDAPSAWAVPGGDGAGIQLVDIEQGWMLNHEDLPRLNTTGPTRTFINLPGFATHGTNALGVVVAVKNNNKGIVGIAHNAGPITLVSERVVDPTDPCGSLNTADAILYAASILKPGDVILLESQLIEGCGVNNLPLEADSANFAAIKQATNMNIIVIEPAGNLPACDLDCVADGNGKQILNRNGGYGFMDSGAIMVAGSSYTAPHTREPHSKYGSRIDCYAWGTQICTTDCSGSKYTDNFGGTSGASSIIAGVALCVQGIAKARGHLLTPLEMRQILSDPNYGTPSASPNADKIGVMPDLNKIIHHPRLQRRN